MTLPPDATGPVVSNGYDVWMYDVSHDPVWWLLGLSVLLGLVAGWTVYEYFTS